MTVGKKIKDLLIEKGWTQIELAAKLGLSPTSGAIAQWIKGRIKPGAANKRRLADIFGKDPSFFEDDEPYSYSGIVMDRRDETQKDIDRLLSNFPLVRPVEVRCEISRENFDFSLYTQPEEFLPIMSETRHSAQFAIKIADTKACPWAAKGEYAVFAGAQEAVSGKIFLVKTNGLYTIKRLIKENNHIILEEKNKKRKKYAANKVEPIAQLLAFYRKA